MISEAGYWLPQDVCVAMGLPVFGTSRHSMVAFVVTVSLGLAEYA